MRRLSMKPKALMMLLLTLFAFNAVQAQVSDCNPNGKDSLLTLRNYTLMHEDVKMKRLEPAFEGWLYVFTNAPCFREQTYVDGIEIYEGRYEKATDDTRKKEIMDTIGMIYQQRIQYFGREGYVKGKWGKTLLDLDKGHPEAGMALIEESIKLDSVHLEDNLVVPYFNYLVALEKANRKTKDDVLKAYETLTEIVDYNIKHPGTTMKLGIYKTALKVENLNENTFTSDKADALDQGLVITLKPSYNSPRYTITNIDSIDITVDKPITEAEGSTIYFVKEAWTVAQENLNNLAAPYLDCQTLASIYTPKFKEDPNNVELMEKILLFLNNAKCTSSDLYFEVSEAYLKLTPDAAGYRNLANAYKSKKNYAKALEVYQKAINIETEDAKKVDDYITMAKIALATKNINQVKTYADKALAINPNKGEAYILIGDSYLHAAANCTDFDKKAIYWVVVDQYIKAKNVDAGIAGAANRRIATYSRYFPSKEEGFFRSINAGDSYTLKCYPNLTTKARYN
ncbi:MAG: tetratricopeptide repeat protein [Bacteroidetes bacterium]|nr:tetratricopeptide repeat protein [Bacteroidota bacterium]